MSEKSRRMAVAIVHHKAVDDEFEEISLRHAKKYFKDYDVYAVVPQGTNALSEFRSIYFESKFFSNYIDNNYLRLSPRFYEKFSSYEYLLIYELDSLVFSDNAIDFCRNEYDYIGAPWVEYMPDNSIKFIGVGNSGFSLRNINSCMKVLTSDTLVKTPSRYWQEIGSQKTGIKKLIGLAGFFAKLFPYKNNIDWLVKKFIYSSNRTWAAHEDKFWLVHAKHFFNEFQIASVEQALKFSFEYEPSYCFKVNNNNLPLGCHAWYKYDKEFWLPYLLK